jgi:hypothetical protein
MTIDRAITRRHALRGLAGTGAGLAGARLLGATPPASPALAAACTLTAEQEEGPYYLGLERIRKNITEGKAGLRLDLRVTIVDSGSCTPIEGVAVDIWHCDAVGVYSGFSREGTAGETYLRGVRLTDADGVASFRTIYPGWYQGRATHIHLKATSAAGPGRARTAAAMWPTQASSSSPTRPPTRWPGCRPTRATARGGPTTPRITSTATSMAQA